MWTFVTYLIVLFCCLPLIACENHVDRVEIINRAQFWSNQSIPYSQAKSAPDPDGVLYRTDCSGFVSMAWKLNVSLNTRTLVNVAIKIDKEDLRSGDILLSPGSHVLIFEAWVSGSKTSYWAYEMAGGKIGKCVHHQIRNYPYWNRSGYIPYRYADLNPDAGSGDRTGPCRCAPYTDLERLKQLNSLGPTYCGYQEQLQGSCISNNIYYCYYNYGLHPNGEGTISVFKTCEHGCKAGSYNSRECVLDPATLETSTTGVGENSFLEQQDSLRHDQEGEACDGQSQGDLGVESNKNIRAPESNNTFSSVCVNNCKECRLALACNNIAICVGNDTWTESCSCGPERKLLPICGGDGFAFCRKICSQCPNPDSCFQADVVGCPRCRTIPPSTSAGVSIMKNQMVWVVGGILGFFFGRREHAFKMPLK